MWSSILRGFNGSNPTVTGRGPSVPATTRVGMNITKGMDARATTSGQIYDGLITPLVTTRLW